MIQTDLKQSVQKLLSETQNILYDEDFSINKNFEFKRQRFKDDPLDPNNNSNTMLALDYDIEDIVEEIKTLTIKDFYDTMQDDRADRHKEFYAFIKIIKGRQVYIKFKISEINGEKILCVSFHFAKYNVDLSKLPFANE